MPIELNQVSYTYSQGTVFETPALRDISLTIEDGEYVGIMGQTGCGKSTLIQLMVGLMKPTSGQIRVDGEDINARDYRREALRRKVGIVFQYPEVQLFETTVEKDVAFGLKHSNLSKAEIAENVRWAIETVGLDFEQVRSVSPFSLSGGEKRRVAIAGILAAKPKILILDEPIAGLDPVGREDFLALTRELNKSGVTIIMVSHSADALAENAQRVIVLEAGRLVMDSPAKEAFSDVDLLGELGVGISQVREIGHLLQDCGFDIPQDTIRYEEILPLLIKIGKGAAS
ncbi:ATP-binding cassette domain-containing protein [bacterium]|nr:ATP-binding cassette domain-containing protein [bacterium]